MQCASAKSHSGRLPKSRTRRQTQKPGSVNAKPTPSPMIRGDGLEKDHYNHRNPPPGYVFVPKGDVYVTRNCRNLTKEAGQVVHQVYDPTTKAQLGLHVPRHILLTVQEKAAASAQSRQEAVKLKDSRDVEKARDILLRRYPRIPKEDAAKVIAHAFQKGSGRVGRTGRETPERRISLAVGAHIRHRHTAYDSLLRQNRDREEARKAVWEDIKRVKSCWKGR